MKNGDNKAYLLNRKNSAKSAVNPVFMVTFGFTADLAEFTNSAKSVVNPAVQFVLYNKFNVSKFAFQVLQN